MSEKNNKELPDHSDSQGTDDVASGQKRLANTWDRLSRIGIAEPLLRFGPHIVTLVIVTVVVILLSNFYLKNVRDSQQVDLQATAQAIAAPTLNAAAGLSEAEAELGASIPSFTQSDDTFFTGIPRMAEPKTVIPSRPRVKVTTYEVQVGDNVFSIAEQYGLRPETVLWGNYAVLQDNPRQLAVGQQLNILPTDGTYHRYTDGESLDTIAKFFGVDAQDIIEWPGNGLDPYETDIKNPRINDGTWLIIPGGERELQDWGPPAITRDNPASAAYYGEGHCGDIYQGAIGSGIFIWPTNSSWLSGYDYNSAIHPAIDIGGEVGDAIYATDSGVVVYSGWSNYGYGYLIVVDHGNGWQSAYAHLSGVGVYCGQSISQGDVIGALGSTGNSSGPHLHFELTSSIYGKVNPWDFLLPP